MAGFPVSGIALVLAGYSVFVSRMGKVSSAYTTQEKKIASLQARVKSYSATSKQLEATQMRLQNTLAKLNKEIARQSKAAADISKTSKQRAAASEKLTDAERKKMVVLKQLDAVEDNIEANEIRMTQSQKELTAATEESAGGASKFSKSLKGIGVAAGVVIGIIILLIAAIVKLIKTLYDLAKALASAIVKAVKTVIDMFKKLLSVVSKLISPITALIKRMAQMATGVVMYDFIRSLVYGFKELAGDVWKTVTAFQALEIRFETIIARDIAKREIIPLSEAMGKAADQTARVVDWIKIMAVTTPFRVEDISKVVALGTAMGMSVGQAQRLTLAVGDYTAALGLSSEVMYRTIYNLGQMIQRQRLTGEELRDLSRNLFPVYEVLDRLAVKFEMTAQEMKDFAIEGGLPVMDFINEFIELAKDDFPNAMLKLSKTWDILIQNVKEFFSVFIGLDMLGPVVKKISEQASEALDKFLSDKMLRQTTQAVGEALSQAFERFIPVADRFVQVMGRVVDSLFPAIKGVRKAGEDFDNLRAILKGSGEDADAMLHPMTAAVLRFVTTLVEIFRQGAERMIDFIEKLSEGMNMSFKQMAENAIAWGTNIIAGLARGMAAAISLVVQVIQMLARIISSWMVSKSPPKMLPHLAEWGTAAMRTYMEGWLKYDFDVFNKIADLIENYLRSIGDRLAGRPLIERILGTRAALARSLNDFRRGLISLQRAIENVMMAARGVTSDFRNFIKLIFRVAEAEKAHEAASRKMEAAQKRLNQVTAYYDAILSDLRSQLTAVTDEYDEQRRLQKINAAIGSGLLTQEERERLEMEKKAILIKQQIRSVEKQRDTEVSAIQARIDAAQAEVDLSQDRLDIMNDQLDAAQALIEAQIKQNDLLQEWIDAAEDAAGAGGAGAGAGAAEDADEDSMFDDILGGGITVPEIDWDSMWADAEKAADEFWAAIFGGGEVDEFGQMMDWTPGILQPLTDLAAEGGPLDDLKGAFGELGESLSGIDWTTFEGGMSAIEKALKPDGALGKLIGWIEGLAEKGGKIEEFAGLFISAFGSIITKSGETETAVEEDTNSIIDWFLQLAVDLGLATEEVTEHVDDMGYEFGMTAQGMLDAKNQKLTPVEKFLKNPLGSTIEWLTLTILPGIKNYITDTLIPAFENWTSDGLKPVNTALEKMVNWLSDLVTWIGDLAIAIGNLDFGEFFRLLTGGVGTSTSSGDRQTGGPVSAGQPYIVGEKRPEVFVPKTDGIIIPSVTRFYSHLLSGNLGDIIAAPPLHSGASGDTINIEINPTYANKQSEAGIYYDVSAALAIASL